MKILIGTMNPGKIQGAKEALEAFFPEVEIEGYKAASDVRDQPVNEETLEGARNRVNNTIKYALENEIDADLYLGIESGIVELYDTWYIMNIAVVKDRDGYESVGIGPALPVPRKYADEIIQTDFGSVMTKIFEKGDLGKGVGGVNSLTNDSISRIQITKDAFVMALTNHAHDYWSDKEDNKVFNK